MWSVTSVTTGRVEGLRHHLPEKNWISYTTRGGSGFVLKVQLWFRSFEVTKNLPFVAFSFTFCE